MSHTHLKPVALDLNGGRWEQIAGGSADEVSQTTAAMLVDQNPQAQKLRARE